MPINYSSKQIEALKNLAKKVSGKKPKIEVEPEIEVEPDEEDEEDEEVICADDQE